METAPAPILRRVGIIGDVHGEDRALYAVLDFLLHQPGLDALLCTGDVIDRRSMGDGCRCCQLLADAGAYTVRGEFDRGYDEKAPSHNAEAIATFLGSLPTTREFCTVAGSPLLLCHDFGEDEQAQGSIRRVDRDDAAAAALEQRGMETCPFVVAGHSHRHGVRRVGETTVIDAGSLYWEDHPCFLIADFGLGTAQFYDVEPFTNRIAIAERFEFCQRTAVAV